MQLFRNTASGEMASRPTSLEPSLMAYNSRLHNNFIYGIPHQTNVYYLISRYLLIIICE